jgi:hypothetical protein
MVTLGMGMSMGMESRARPPADEGNGEDEDGGFEGTEDTDVAEIAPRGVDALSPNLNMKSKVKNKGKSKSKTSPPKPKAETMTAATPSSTPARGGRGVGDDHGHACVFRYHHVQSKKAMLGAATKCLLRPRLEPLVEIVVTRSRSRSRAHIRALLSLLFVVAASRICYNQYNLFPRSALKKLQ